MARLSEYELERQANIQRNQELLKSLGILNAEVAPSRKADEAAAAKERRKEKRARASENGPVFRPPRRKSARLAASTSASSESPPATRTRSASARARSSRNNINMPSSDPIDLLTSSQLSASPERVRPVVQLRSLPPPPPRMPVLREDDESLPPAPLPTRDKTLKLKFEDEPYFTPNMTPEEIIRAGSFGGTAFQKYKSQINGSILPSSDYLEFPTSWYHGLDVSLYLTSPEYRPEINKYGVKASQSLKEWELAGWVREQDPRGWFQWYCRFYLGRRSPDDGRQIRRWLGVCGPAGRFKKALVKRVAEEEGRWDDEEIAPVLRQTLQHWAYKLTEADYRAYL